MKIICFTIVTTVGLCITMIPFFKSGSDDIEEAGFASSMLLPVILFIVVFFGEFLFS